MSLEHISLSTETLCNISDFVRGVFYEIYFVLFLFSGVIAIFLHFVEQFGSALWFGTTGDSQ